MPKYEVTIKVIEVYVIRDIAADSEDEAKDKAELILDATCKDKYHNDSEVEVTVTDDY